MLPVGFMKTHTHTPKTHTHGCGHGFPQVQVQVALENPRVACDNPYIEPINTDSILSMALCGVRSAARACPVMSPSGDVLRHVSGLLRCF